MLGHLRSNAVAYVALFFGLTGASFGAASKLAPANSVGTRQVIDHSLLRQDFKAGQLPRGPQGDIGPQGDAGPPGDPGPASIPNMTNITLTWALVDPLHFPDEVRAFIPTGSG